LFAHGRWFSPGTPASSTNKTGRHDIAKALLKVALKHQKSINHITCSDKGVKFRQFSLYIQIIHNNNTLFTLFFLYLTAIYLCNTKHPNIFFPWNNILETPP
jgi:hypothetical protein